MSSIRGKSVYVDGERYCDVKDLFSPDCDIPLLRKHLEWVEEQSKLPSKESSWRQSLWYTSQVEDGVTCGSFRCFAGNVAYEAGAEFIQPLGHSIVHSLLTPDGKEELVSDFAAKRLGINSFAETALFDSRNGVVGIRQICEAIAGERL